jgi:hypothetical protein
LLGKSVGLIEGFLVGKKVVGMELGFRVIEKEGLEVGIRVGLNVGDVGFLVGRVVGLLIGTNVGFDFKVGKIVGF